MSCLKWSVLFCFVCPSLFSLNQENGTKKWTFEGKVGYFYPTGKRFRDIYSGGFLYALQLQLDVWQGISSWASCAYLHERGRSLGERYDTTITLLPVSIGINYMIYCDLVAPYFGIGWNYSYIETHDDSPFVLKKTSYLGKGQVLKGGICFSLPFFFFLDLFFDYGWMKIGTFKQPEREKVDLGYTCCGGSLGKRF